jgi:exopolysaccharide production protein ExoZ
LICNIQALRALAAYMVVFVHLATLFAPLGVSEQQLAVGAVGVDLFFVISGFIMVFTTTGRTVTPLGFLENRIARVVPLYWLLTLAVFALALVWPASLKGTTATAGHLFDSLFFIPYLREDGFARPILFLGWSLNYEMFFYVFYAGGLFLRGAVRRVLVVTALLAALVIIGQLVAFRSVPAIFYTRPVIFEFGLGMLLGIAYPYLTAQGFRLWLWALCLVVGLGLLLIFPLFVDAGTPINAAASAMVVAAALALERSGHALRWTPALRMGDASYSLYLVHPFATQSVGKLASRLGFHTPFWAVIMIVIALAAATVLALLTHRFIEQPLSRWARRLLAAPRRELPARGL